MYTFKVGYFPGEIINEKILHREMCEYIEKFGKVKVGEEDDRITFTMKIGNEKSVDFLDDLPPDILVFRVEDKNGVVYEYDQAFLVNDPSCDLDDKIYHKSLKINKQTEGSEMCTIS